MTTLSYTTRGIMMEEELVGPLQQDKVQIDEMADVSLTMTPLKSPGGEAGNQNRGQPEAEPAAATAGKSIQVTPYRKRREGREPTATYPTEKNTIQATEGGRRMGETPRNRQRRPRNGDSPTHRQADSLTLVALDEQ